VSNRSKKAAGPTSPELASSVDVPLSSARSAPRRTAPAATPAQTPTKFVASAPNWITAIENLIQSLLNPSHNSNHNTTHNTTTNNGGTTHNTNTNTNTGGTNTHNTNTTTSGGTTTTTTTNTNTNGGGTTGTTTTTTTTTTGTTTTDYTPAPNPTTGQQYALFLTEPGDTTAISISDVHQGGIGDCYLVAPLGELALTHPASIQNMITVNSDGSETVTLYEEASGRVPTPNYQGAYKTVEEHVTNNFNAGINSGPTTDVVNGVKEIWGQVLEQAIAQLAGGWSSITGGGYPEVTMEELTGVNTTSILNPGNNMTLAQLEGFVNNNDMLTFDTANNPTGYNLVGSHVYMFKSLDTANGGSVTLLNPWGGDNPSAAIPLSQLNGNIVEVDAGHF
jgi:hypothetical protein